MWETAKLIDVCERITQGPNPKYDGDLREDLRVLKTKHLYDNVIHYEEADKLSYDAFQKCANAKLINGDVLLAIVGQGSINKCNVFLNPSEHQFIFTRALGLLRPKKNTLDSFYLKYFLQSDQGKGIVDSGIGGTSGQQVVTTTHLKNIEIPLPPLPEQKRIVAILDQAFAEIDRARELTKRNLNNARELFESYLQQVFSKRGEGWTTHKLSELCTLISGQHIDAKNYNNDGVGIGYLTGPSDFGDLNPIVSKWTEHPKRTAINGDILITVKGSGVGSVNVMNFEELAISRQLMAVRPEGVMGEILYWFLSLQFNYFQSLANGAAIPGISRSDVLDLELSIPHVNNQSELAKEIADFRSECAQLERTYTDKLYSLDELKKSLLQKAFSGELTNNKDAA